MAKYRRGRINDEVKKELSMILREVKDPRITDAFISITAVDVTGDLKFAKVYYSAMQGDKKEVAAGLKSSSGFIRREVARRLNLRMRSAIYPRRRKTDTPRHNNRMVSAVPPQISTCVRIMILYLLVFSLDSW